MFCKIKKLKNILPVTITKAVYIDGTDKTISDAMKEGHLGDIGKTAVYKEPIYPNTEIMSVPSRGLHDCTIIGNDYVSFDKWNDGGGMYWMDMDSKDVVRGSIRLDETVDSATKNIEMKSVDYAYEKLLVGNGSSSYTVTNSKLYVFHDVLRWKTKGETVTFDNCGNYDVIDIVDLGYKVYGFWGNADDIVFVSCNLFKDVYQIQLGKGSTKYEYGTFATADATRYNGSYTILGHWSQSEVLMNGVAAHGGQYYKGHLYIANNAGGACEVLKCVFEKNGLLAFQPLKYNKISMGSDGTKSILYHDIDGMCIKDGKIYTQPLSSAREILIFDI